MVEAAAVDGGQPGAVDDQRTGGADEPDRADHLRRVTRSSDDFYGQLAVDPFAAANVAEMTAPGSDAYAFVLHEAGVAIAIYNNTTVPLPNYTVTDNGATVSVCNDADECDSFGDFRIAGVALDTFSIDGQPMAERVSAFERPTTVEALTSTPATPCAAPRRGAQRRRPAGLGGRRYDVLLGAGELRRHRRQPVRHRPGREPVPAANRGRTVHRRPREFAGRPARRPAGDPDHHRPDSGCDDDPHPCHTSLMSARRRLVAVVLAGSLGVAGGASSTSVTGAALAPEATAVPTTVAGAPVFDAVDFFTDLFAGINADPHDHGDLPQRVVAGSPADAFVTYLFGFGSAREASRQGPLEPFTVSGDDTAVEVCTEGSATRSRSSSVSDGRLESFLLNGVDHRGSARRAVEGDRARAAGARSRRRRLRARDRRRAGGRHRHRSRRGPDRQPGRNLPTSTRRGTTSTVDLLASAYPA